MLYQWKKQNNQIQQNNTVYPLKEKLKAFLQMSLTESTAFISNV